jgi:hypothetical protein
VFEPKERWHEIWMLSFQQKATRSWMLDLKQKVSQEIGCQVSSKGKVERNWVLCVKQKKGGKKLDVGF